MKINGKSVGCAIFKNDKNENFLNYRNIYLLCFILLSNFNVS